MTPSLDIKVLVSGSSVEGEQRGGLPVPWPRDFLSSGGSAALSRHRGALVPSCSCLHHHRTLPKSTSAILDCAAPGSIKTPNPVSAEPVQSALRIFSVPKASSLRPCVATKLLRVLGKRLAGGLGFEPRLTESESAVLPLNYPPSGKTKSLTGARAWAQARARRREAVPKRGIPARQGSALGAARGRPAW